MKKLLIYLFLFIISSAGKQAYGQVNIYRPFPDTNAVWAWRYWDLYHPNIGAGEVRYGLRGDTIIHGKNYKKLYSIHDTTITDLTYTPPSTYYAAIREQNKRIYTVIDTSKEQLLYDFDLSLGDTITYDYSRFNYPSTDTFSRIVTKIDSILLLDGKYRKRWTLASGVNCFLSDIVVEGVGSIGFQGLFTPLFRDLCTCSTVSEFTCFKQNDTTLYIGNTLCYKCFCSLLTGINNVNGGNNISISPNPFSIQTTVNIHEQLKINNGEFIMYDIFGREVKKLPIVNFPFTINREGLPSGLYFLRFTEDNKTLATDKLVITD